MRLPVKRITIYHPEKFGVDFKKITPVKKDRAQLNKIAQAWGGRRRNYKGRTTYAAGRQIVGPSRADGQALAAMIREGRLEGRLMRVNESGRAAKRTIVLAPYKGLRRRRRDQGQLTKADLEVVARGLEGPIRLLAVWDNPGPAGRWVNIMVGPFAWEDEFKPFFDLRIEKGELILPDNPACT